MWRVSLPRAVRALVLLALALAPLAAAVASDYDPDTPLLLDAYLADATSRAQGRNLSLVSALPAVYSPDAPTTTVPLPFALHAGLFSIAPSCALFFQLFSPLQPSRPASSLPLIVFLAGGPGVAASYWSLYGGVGPLTFSLSPSPRLLYHNSSWAEEAHVLMIDSPIGVGYSQCTAGSSLRAANNSVVTEHLLTFMRSFLVLFDDLAARPLYIAGHSYGGRTAPDLAAALSAASLPVAGIIVESGLTQPYLSFSELCNGVYLQGLFNVTERAVCNSALDQLSEASDAGDEAKAVAAVSATFPMITRANGGNAYQDFERRFTFAHIDNITAFVTSANIRVAMHVGKDTPYAALPQYIFTDAWSGQSLTALNSLLAGNTRVLYFNSNKDSLLGTSTQRMLAATDYTRRVGWNSTQPVVLRQAGSNETRGFVKRDAKLWFATLLDASHEISIVQPALVRQLIADFTRADSDEAEQPENCDPLSHQQKLLNHRLPMHRPTLAYPPLSAVDVSPAVYLSPYLSMADGAELAQQASAVTLPSSDVLAANSTHSGYITIDRELGSHSFFWLLPSLDKNESAPLILHLSGGPGISSMAMGFLYQHGPFAVDQSMTDPLATHYRPDNYNEHSHVLYVDNPIGTGFSYTDSPSGLRKDSREVADDLYELLRQFFLLFPAYRNCRLYVHGVSYAGHFLPTLGWKIHQENLRRGADEQMLFEGLFIASGWMDEPSQLEEEDAFLMSIGRMDIDHHGVGLRDLDPYNYVWGDAWDYEEPGIMAYLRHPAVVSALHAGPRGLYVSSFNDSVNNALANDPSVKDEVEQLLSSGGYHVVMYAAEYDVVCAASGITNFIASLDYTRKSEWESAASKEWWPQPSRPEWQSRQPPHTSPLQPWQPQSQGIWWSSAPHLTLHHALIRFAGHLVEHTHLYQAGQIIARVQNWPTLPKPEAEEEEHDGSGVARAAIALLILLLVFAVGAAVQWRMDKRQKAATIRGSSGSTLSTSLLGDDESYNNSML